MLYIYLRLEARLAHWICVQKREGISVMFHASIRRSEGQRRKLGWGAVLCEVLVSRRRVHTLKFSSMIMHGTTYTYVLTKALNFYFIFISSSSSGNWYTDSSHVWCFALRKRVLLYIVEHFSPRWCSFSLLLPCYPLYTLPNHSFAFCNLT